MLTRYLRNITLILLLTFGMGKVHAQEVQSDIDFLKEVQAALTKGVVKDAINMMKDSVGINIYPAFHIADDSALWPYALELYFDVRIERKEPYVMVKLNLNPSTGKWTDFSSYSLSVSLIQGQQKAVPTTVIVAAEKQLNEILANIGNLREYFGKVRDNIAETIQKLRFAMMDKYFEGKDLPLVRFYPSPEQQFGFDYPVQQEIIGKYKNFYRYDTIQRVPWKALSTTKPDKINAYIQLRDTNFSVSKIRFVNRSDVKLQPSTTKDDTLIFQLTGTSKDQDDEITAEYVETDPKGKERKAPIGQVKTIAYQEETNIVHIVPVGVKYPATEKDLEKFLNKVYNQAVTNWTVVFDKAIDVKDWDLDGDDILNIETGMFQRYSDEEQVFIDALEKANGTIDPKAAYMFITNVPNNLNARGYMPLSSQFGFIFLNGVTWDTNDEIELLNTTVAHELGHGVYKLKHPWDEYGTMERQTANLLDYQNGNILWKPQWDWIHDPGVRLYIFQKAADGAMKNIEIFAVQKLLDFIKANDGKTAVAFDTKDYYADIFDLFTYVKVYIPVKLENSKEIKVFIDFKAANGILDLSRNISNLYNHIGINIDLKDEYHTGFYVNFKSADNSKLIELWTKTYEEYKSMLDYLGFKISDEAGINYFVNQYKKAIEEAKNDCNKLDVIFESIPPFVLPKLGDDGNWASLSSLFNCSKSKWGTNEYQAIANILNGFTPEFLYNKINENKKLFRELIDGVPENLLSEYIFSFSNAGASKWTDQEIKGAGSAYAQPFEVRMSSEEVMLNFDENYVMYVGLYSLNGKDMNVTSFQLGRGYSTFKDGEPLYKRQDVLELNQYDYFSPVNLSFNEGCDIIMPVFMAYEIVKRYAASSPAVQVLQLYTSVLLPELTMVKFRNLARLFKIRSSANVAAKIDEMLLSELDALTSGTSGTLKPYVQSNLQKLLNNPETIWAMPNATKRGQIFEEILSYSDFATSKGWTNIGQLKGGTQELGDFFHNRGVFSQVKTTNITNPSSISSTISTYKKVIDKLANVKASGNFTTSAGQQLQVVTTRLDIVVPKGYNTGVFGDIVTYASQPNKSVIVNFIFK